jgi:hypothetical protein
MTDRIRTKLWIDAHVRTCFGADMPAFVVAKGDEDRGGVILKVNRFAAGVLLFEQSLDFDGNKVWRRLGAEAGEPEADADERVRKKRSFDPDLWVIEIEDQRAAYAPDAPIAAF